MSTVQKNKTLFYSVLALVIIHLAGVIGIKSSWSALFLSLTPVNLMVCTALFFINHKTKNTSFYVFAIVVFLCGFFVEVAGVATGKVFGVYTYGATLGLKLFAVPLVMGLNWLMLIYCAGCICHKLKTNIVFKSITGAAMLTALDILIEPSAMRYDFWNWAQSIIPVQNFVAWFVISFVLLLFFFKMDIEKNNALARPFYLVQLIFFALLTAI